MSCGFKPGDSVKINAYVYTNKWEGWKELYNKYGHHNLIVDRVIDMSDIPNSENLVVVGYPYAHCNKSVVKESYLWKT